RRHVRTFGDGNVELAREKRGRVHARRDARRRVLGERDSGDGEGGEAAEDQVCEFQSLGPSASATVDTSLSPRPQRFIIVTPPVPMSRATSPTRASAWDGSNAGRIPSSLAHS